MHAPKPQPKPLDPDRAVVAELTKLNATLMEIRGILQAMNVNLNKIAGTRL